MVATNRKLLIFGGMNLHSYSESAIYDVDIDNVEACKYVMLKKQNMPNISFAAQLKSNNQKRRSSIASVRTLLGAASYDGLGSLGGLQ